MSNYNFRYWTDGNSDGKQGGYNVRTNTNYDAALEAMNLNGGSGLQYFNNGSWGDYVAPSASSGSSSGKAQSIHGLSSYDNYANSQGLAVVGGGTNIYGHSRPDHVLMRTMDGQLHDRYKESLGDSYQTLKSFGEGYNSDVDPRETIQMGSAYQAMQDKAMAEGDSKWATLQRKAQNDQIDGNANQALANAQAQMAMRGGLTNGSRERMTQQTLKNALSQKQGANAAISLQDEQMKNQMLGQVGNVQQQINQYNAGAQSNSMNRGLTTLSNVGAAEQNINRSNIGALRGDLQQENLRNFGLYSEDMGAWGAQQSADAQRAAGSSSSCFVEGTKIRMHEGHDMSIEDIEVGDVCENGGAVYKTTVAIEDGYYEYRGIKVTGSHAVYEKGRFIRVEDSELAKYIEKPTKVYCLSNQNHRIIINDIVFADYCEVEGSDWYTPKERLEILNGF